MRAGKGRNIQNAEAFMRSAGQQWMACDLAIHRIRGLVVLRELHRALFKREMAGDHPRRLERMAYFVKREAWAHDEILNEVHNMEKAIEFAKDYELGARIEWETAEEREWQQIEDPERFEADG